MATTIRFEGIPEYLSVLESVERILHSGISIDHLPDLGAVFTADIQSFPTVGALGVTVVVKPAQCLLELVAAVSAVESDLTVAR